MKGRRSFIRNTGVVLAAPVLADLVPIPTAARIQSLDPPPRQFPPRATTDESAVAFKIEGWSASDDDARAGGISGDIWIRIGHSWRTSWR
jgi:hypothetical protein